MTWPSSQRLSKTNPNQSPSRSRKTSLSWSGSHSSEALWASIVFGYMSRRDLDTLCSFPPTWKDVNAGMVLWDCWWSLGEVWLIGVGGVMSCQYRVALSIRLQWVETTKTFDNPITLDVWQSKYFFWCLTFGIGALTFWYLVFGIWAFDVCDVCYNCELLWFAWPPPR